MAHKVAHRVAHKVAHRVAHKVAHRVAHKVAHRVAHGLAHGPRPRFCPHPLNRREVVRLFAHLLRGSLLKHHVPTMECNKYNADWGTLDV